MKFEIPVIVNQKSKTMYPFKNKELLQNAKAKLKGFDNIYQEYGLQVDVTHDGAVYICDPDIDDLEEPVLLERLDPELLSLSDSDLKEKMIKDFSLIKEEYGYKFSFKEIEPPESDSENSM